MHAGTALHREQSGETGDALYFPKGKTFRKTDVFAIDKAHIKLWAPSRQAAIFGAVLGVKRTQSLLCKATGCGFFGLQLESDAVVRFDALEDNQISVDHADDVEVVGCDVHGAAASGVFLYGSQRHFIEGNYIHETQADHIHHTQGARTSWCWDNWIYNKPPTKGDDGIACVTYGVSSAKCGDMEWWHNTILEGGWGRGYSVIGGDHIDIHDNWAIATAGAGLIVASEGSYDSASSSDITIHDNFLYGCAHTIGHPGILVSGLNGAAPPLDKLTFTNNVVVNTVSGVAYKEEGALSNVTNQGMSTNEADLPARPELADVAIKDTGVLRMRDSSFVASELRPGLYRIHVRQQGVGFEQRFEYVFRGEPSAVEGYLGTLYGVHVSETRVVGGSAYVLLLSAAPLALPASLAPVSFEELRAGDRDGSLAWLWKRVDSYDY